VCVRTLCHLLLCDWKDFCNGESIVTCSGRFFITFPLWGVQSTVINMFVCLSLCFISVHVTCCRGSALVWQQCSMLHTSSFVDGVTCIPRWRENNVTASHRVYCSAVGVWRDSLARCACHMPGCVPGGVHGQARLASLTHQGQSVLSPIVLLWPPCVADADIIFSSCAEIGCLPYFHTWCGLSANLKCRSEACCARLAENTGRKKVAKNRYLGTIAQLCRAISSQLKHISPTGKKSC